MSANRNAATHVARYPVISDTPPPSHPFAEDYRSSVFGETAEQASERRLNAEAARLHRLTAPSTPVILRTRRKPSPVSIQAVSFALKGSQRKVGIK